MFFGKSLCQILLFKSPSILFDNNFTFLILASHYSNFKKITSIYLSRGFGLKNNKLIETVRIFLGFIYLAT